MSLIRLQLRSARFLIVCAALSASFGSSASAQVARALKPLKAVNVPIPSNIDDFVANREAAVALGKALFWDMQAGSDGKVACATCHFHAGADGRIGNTLGLPKDNPNKVRLRNAISKLKESDFPFVRVSGSNPLDPTAVVTQNIQEIVGSKGAELRTFNRIELGKSVDQGTVKPDPDFNFHGANLRTVTSRNSPSVINSVFNYRNNWDGRASFIFNGVNQYGKFDPEARVLQASFSYKNSYDAFIDKIFGTRDRAIQTISKVQVALDNGSLASQATAPPTATEMSWEGRTFPELGRKLLSLRPLAKQEVYFTDSTLAPFDNYYGTGLYVSYSQLIRKAFNEKWWGSRLRDAKGYTQMEANFSLYWGISLLMYQRTLVSDDTPLDRFLAGDTGALSPQAQTGLSIFRLGCNICHSGAETTSAAVEEIIVPKLDTAGKPVLDANGKTVLVHKPVQIMLRGEKDGKPNPVNPTFYDRGFYNTGVQVTTNDLGSGRKDEKGEFSLTKRAKLLGNTGRSLAEFVDGFAIDAPIQALPIAVDGTFKTPMLRNVELTGPYLHSGGMLFLEEVMEHYGRGANFRNENRANLDQGVAGIPGLQDPVQGPGGIVALTAFLMSMTDERVRNQSGPFDHPQLLLPDGVQSVSNGTVLENFTDFPAVGRYGVKSKFWGTISGQIIKPFHQILRESAAK